MSKEYFLCAKRFVQIPYCRSGKCYRTTCEVEFGITSLTRQKVEIRRVHLGIESGLHYRRGIILKEDAARITLLLITRPFPIV